jgi:hypothetical protein
MGNEKKSLYDRYLGIMTLRNTMLFMWLLTLAVAIYPLGLPKLIVPEVVDGYQTIQDTITDGSLVIWIDEEQTMSQFVNQRDSHRAVVWALCDRGAKFICLSLSPSAPSGIEYILKYSRIEEKYGYVYGEDYVICPYVAGEENALAAMADNVRLTVVDYYGNNLDDLSVMDGVNTILDVDMFLFGCSSTTQIHFYARQWLVKYDDAVRPKAISWYGYSEWAPYYPRYCQGATMRSVDAQFVTGYFGEDVIKLDANNVCWAYTCITFALAAITKAISKSRGEKIEASIGGESGVE